MDNTQTANESKGFYKLNWLQRIGFGSGDLAQNLIFQVICTYLLFFYTDIYGLTPSAVAVMFLVGNVANVIWDPIVGTLIDKSNPRFGKYRSYLCHLVLLQRFCTFVDLCIRHLYFDAIALHIHQCAIRSVELFVNSRYGRNHHPYLGAYVHGKPRWFGS